MKYPGILNEEVARVGVQESQLYNLMAGKMVSEMISTSLGPRGMEKVYIDILGELTITKHGGAFLRKLDVDHPAAKAVIEAANAVDNHVGDGTISTAVLTGNLLKQAEELLKKKVPTSAIVRGYEKSLEYALEALDGIKIKPANKYDPDIMKNLVMSCLEGKALFDSLVEPEDLTDILIEAVQSVADFDNGKVDTDDIKIEEKPGNSVDIQLVMGTVIDKSIDNPAMPTVIEDVRILLLNESLETMRTKTESQIEITSPGQMSQFVNQERDDVLYLVKKVIDSGANVVISRKGISEVAQEYLAKAGVITIRRAKYNDLWWLEKSTGAKTCKSIEDISSSELGYASKVYEKTIGGDKMLFVEGSEQPKSVTLLLRATSKQYLDEFHRTALNAINVLRNFVQDSHIVYGGGSSESLIAQKVRKKALDLDRKEQIVVERFADAIESIPLTLARNVGMNTLDVLPQLRSSTGKNHFGKDSWYGVNSSARKVEDLSTSGIVETYVVKKQMIQTAVETANMIINVDDVFAWDLADNTHCHIDGTVHTHKDGGKDHNHFEQEGAEQRQMHHYY